MISVPLAALFTALLSVAYGFNLEPSPVASLPHVATNILPSTDLPTLNSIESNITFSVANVIVSSPSVVAL